jgi:hypothetical protein
VLTVTSKRLIIFESRGNLNRCTPCRGKSDIHDTYDFHDSPRMPLICFLRVVFVRGNLSRWLNRVRQIHCSWEKVFLTPPLSPAKWLTGLTSVSLQNIIIEAVRLIQTSVDKHAINTFNTCSQGPTYRPLTDTDMGYNLEGADLPHHTPWLSQSMVLRFPPKSLTRCQVNNLINTNWIREEQILNLTSGSLHSTSTVIYHLSIALLTVNHHMIGLTRVIRKVDPNATIAL